jgi:hypothetical protein
VSAVEEVMEATVNDRAGHRMRRRYSAPDATFASLRT